MWGPRSQHTAGMELLMVPSPRGHTLAPATRVGCHVARGEPGGAGRVPRRGQADGANDSARRPDAAR